MSLIRLNELLNSVELDTENKINMELNILNDYSSKLTSFIHDLLDQQVLLNPLKRDLDSLSLVSNKDFLKTYKDIEKSFDDYKSNLEKLTYQINRYLNKFPEYKTRTYIFTNNPDNID